ncbi:hypothetical protein BDZ45DRAFT_747384 [Acephala macrosclerotiorum]|nr:hypothetical protein BDZ45DRAFT_747384 [Acephala macrosclerotiorum]
MSGKMALAQLSAATPPPATVAQRRTSEDGAYYLLRSTRVPAILHACCGSREEWLELEENRPIVLTPVADNAPILSISYISMNIDTFRPMRGVSKSNHYRSFPLQYIGASHIAMAFTMKNLAMVLISGPASPRSMEEVFLLDETEFPSHIGQRSTVNLTHMDIAYALRLILRRTTLAVSGRYTAQKISTSLTVPTETSSIELQNFQKKNRTTNNLPCTLFTHQQDSTQVLYQSSAFEMDSLNVKALALDSPVRMTATAASSSIITSTSTSTNTRESESKPLTKITTFDKFPIEL